MKMITDSLAKVYTAMGGTDPFNKDDIAEGIDQISEVARSGGSGGGDVVYIDTVLVDGNLTGIAESYNSLKALYDAHKTVRFNCLFTESHDGFTTYRNLCPILVSFEQGDSYRAVFVYATYDGAYEMAFQAETAEANLVLND